MSVWKLAAPPPPDLAVTPGLDRLIARLLWIRHIRTPAEIESWLHPRYLDLPPANEYLHLQTAIDRLIVAINKAEQITVYGDYDADGISATAIMVLVLNKLGAKVNWYVPTRLDEGYGLNSQAVTTLAGQGTKLLLAVDCGTSNTAEIELANTLEMDTIVLDHHQPSSALPPALAVINPHREKQTYPFMFHSAGGIAFTMARSLVADANRSRLNSHKLDHGWEKWLLDLVAISTVADLMPLRGDNRIFVHFGLTVLKKGRRPGLRALAATMGVNWQQATATTIGYQLAPRLNAAGRLEHAGLAVRLLLCEDLSEARSLAEELNRINTRRQELTELAVNEAWEQIKERPEQNAYVAYATHWSPGIVGLVAGRLVEKVWRPILVITKNGDQIIGSGRSIPGFDITAHLRTAADKFHRFGGHAGACGFTLKPEISPEELERWFVDSVHKSKIVKLTGKPVNIDLAAKLADFNEQLIDQLAQLEPHGVDNPRPIFMVNDVRVENWRAIGQNKQHLKIRGRQGDETAEFIGFRLADRVDQLKIGDRLDLCLEVSWNEWQGRRERQFKIIDFRPHET